MAEIPTVGVVSSERTNRLFTAAGSTGVVVRAPGRVNLLGEHVDYSGFGVLPMAIVADVMVSISSRAVSSGAPTLTVKNVDDSFAEVSYDLSDPAAFELPNSKHNWTYYFACGFLGILDHMGTKPPIDLNIEVLVDGSIPTGAGVSSSSAFVVASALATASLFSVSLNKTELALVAIKGERYVGTMSGGMDQAASVLSVSDSALYIQFRPSLKATPVPLPSGVEFVVCNCLRKKEKAVNPHQYYNKRVVECRLAAMCMSKLLNLPWGDIKTLGDVAEASDASLDSLSILCEQQIGEALSLDSIVTLLPAESSASPNDIASTFFADFHDQSLSVLQHNTSFDIWRRAKHVFEEAARVIRVSGLESIDANEFARLMNDSHSSCKDQFDCSCDELDKLVEVSLKAGAMGSRLTGAGWGGCTVSCVPTEMVPKFIENVKQRYYREFMKLDKIPDATIIVSSGGPGASILCQA